MGLGSGDLIGAEEIFLSISNENAFLGDSIVELFIEVAEDTFLVFLVPLVTVFGLLAGVGFDLLHIFLLGISPLGDGLLFALGLGPLPPCVV